MTMRDPDFAMKVIYAEGDGYVLKYDHDVGNGEQLIRTNYIACENFEEAVYQMMEYFGEHNLIVELKCEDND